MKNVNFELHYLENERRKIFKFDKNAFQVFQAIFVDRGKLDMNASLGFE